jgi:PAS domain-containing protein
MDVARRPEPTDPTADSQRRRTLAAAQIGAWSRNLSTGAGHVDPAWCQSLGLDPCQGDDHFERWARRIHPDDAGRFLRSSADLLSAPAAKAEFELEYRILTLDSRWLWVMQRGRITRRSGDGRPLEAAGICIEIDARKRAEVEAHENESRLATALWGAQASFWQIHRPSDTAIRSPLWYAMTGYSREAWEVLAHSSGRPARSTAADRRASRRALSVARIEVPHSLRERRVEMDHGSRPRRRMGFRRPADFRHRRLDGHR